MSLRYVVYANDNTAVPDDDPTIPHELADHLAASDPGLLEYGCFNLDHFVSWLQGLKRRHRTIGEMTLISHGAAGSLAFGTSTVSISNLYRIVNADISEVFARGATIRIIGCELVADADGELFLARFARCLLNARGGLMTASRVAIAYVPGTTVSFALAPDSWVEARVATGGNVTLANHVFLDSGRLNARLAAAQRTFDAVGSHIPPERRRGTEDKLYQVRMLLRRGRSTSYTDLHTANDRLKRIEDRLALLLSTP